MKFVINATTVSNANEQLIKELRPIKHLFGGDWDEMVKASESTVTSCSSCVSIHCTNPSRA